MVRVGVESFDAVAPEWDALAEATLAEPFQFSGWIGAWWKAFGKGRLEIVVARDGGDLVGVLPIVRTRAGWRSPTNWHTPRFGPILGPDDCLARIFAFITSRRASVLDLAFLLKPYADQVFKAASTCGWEHLGRRQVLNSPYVEISSTWEEYWAARSNGTRNNVRRAGRLLAEQGEVGYRLIDGTEGLDKHLEQGFAIEASGWKSTQKTAIISRPETERFYRDIANWAASRGEARLAFLTIDGDPIAFNLSLEARGRHYLLKIGHLEEFGRASPGTALTAWMLESCFERGMERYEFLGGPDQYKMRWADGCHDIQRIKAFSRRPAGRIANVTETRLRPIATRLLR